MRIRIDKQPSNMGEDHELCCMCFEPTPYWHLARNLPLCEPCARTFNPSDLPKMKEYLDEAARVEASRKNMSKNKLVTAAGPTCY